MSSGSAEPHRVSPGDRYVTSEPCCATCRHSDSDSRSEVTPSFLAVAPYSFVFNAPAKGRWLGSPVLDVCVAEFAYAPPPPQLESPTRNDNSGSAQATTTLDQRVTLPAYLEELCEGHLWLHGREAECRAAGHTYKQHIISAWRAARGTDGETTATDAAADGDANQSEGGEAAWAGAKAWLHAQPTEAAAARALLLLPPLLVLGQRDSVYHRVWRQEGRMFADEPLEVLRCDLAQRESNNSSAVGCRPALLVLNKPSGLPVHPSGRYRRNSCTLVLEDIFGGCDAGHYEIREVRNRSEGSTDGHGGDGVQQEDVLINASIVHKVYGFTLITVRIRPPNTTTPTTPAPSAAGNGNDAGGVSLEDWSLMRRLFDQSSAASPQGQQQHQPRKTIGDSSLAPLKAFVVHRLDAATSGVLIFGLDQPTARHTSTLISQKGDDDDSGGQDDKKGKDGVDAVAIVTAAAKRQENCSKTYLAIVRGRLDTTATINGGVCHEGDAPPSDRWLRVHSPIGCLSFRNSLYWCPGRQRIRRWHAWVGAEAAERGRDQAAIRAKSQQQVVVVEGESSTARKGKKDAAAAAVKHEIMRQLSMGRAKRPRPVGSDPATHNNTPTTTTHSSGSGQADRPADTFLSTLRSATTLLRTVGYNAASDETMVACRLLTGRTHQLRVHLACLGHPIAGDDKYKALVDCLDQGNAPPVSGSRWQRMLSRGIVSDDDERSSGNENAPVEEEEDDDDVGVYYKRVSQLAAGAANSDTTTDGDGGTEGDKSGPDACVCPRRIGLHAWRYLLRYPIAADCSGAMEAEAAVALEFIAPPYGEWMRREAEKALGN